MTKVLLAGYPVDYVDEGCEYSPTCLDCPLPKCKHDAPGEMSYVEMQLRNRRIVKMARTSRKKDIAKAFGLSLWTIRWILREADCG